MSNFAFLSTQTEYALFSPACVEAERVLSASPAMCAVGCRKALELAVKWVYAADNTMEMPYKDNLQALIHEQSFRFAMDDKTWGKLPYIIKLGNLAVHTNKGISKSDSMLALRGLFDFVQWIDYCYGANYEERAFSEELIPSEQVIVDEKKVREKESLLTEKDTEIERLRKQVEYMSARYSAEKEQHKESRNYEPEDISEFETRKKYIDVDLKLLGWVFGDDVQEEFEVDRMNGVYGQMGKVDYVLFGKDGLPLAVIEAKRTSKDPNVGRQQAKLYADCLEHRYGRRPMMFTTNGFETYFWDDKSAPQRPVSGVFSSDDLQKLMNRREERKNLSEIEIDDKITDRYYQKAAIRAVCDNITAGYRRSLLVMATGTGKTRTASSLTDVLSRGGHITNVLFLADRTALVKQAKNDFQNYLPDMSLCNLLVNKDDKNARIVFSTYPTMLNAIDSAKSSNGLRLFTPAHFDLIIVDEAHRSIFKKYRAIFEYFDALVVGLTATPKIEVDRNTYDFFEMEHGIPTYAYDYETARDVDHVLVPYYNVEVSTKFLSDGISYDDLSDEDKLRFEEDFAEDDTIPDSIPSNEINKFVFNQNTVEIVLQDLMTKGIKTAGGDRIGKTIIFAQNKAHAQYIVERFDALYPQYKGEMARRIVCDDAYADTLIDDFKQPVPPTPYNAELEKSPHIAVSVNMLDTGIDAPHIVNLVFFKRVHSKTKFWQMLGRGTRLCKNLECVDSIDGTYVDKRRFYIFDYMENFEFFRARKNGFESKETQSLSEAIFVKQVRLVHCFQEAMFSDEAFQAWRKELAEALRAGIAVMNPELITVKMKLRYVEKFKKAEAFDFISQQDKHELTSELAPLAQSSDEDEHAKRFDNFMYGLMIAQLESAPAFKRAKTQLCSMAAKLQKRSTIPQVKDKMTLINAVDTDAFWDNADLRSFEQIRLELRDLIKFINDDGGRTPIYTNLQDVVLAVKEGEILDPGYDFEDYRKKVNRYIETHKDHLAIYKLRNNIKLTAGDYQDLSDILTKELGNPEDYKREYEDLPFGLLVRKVAKLEYDAAMEVFSDYINDQAINSQQIAFVKTIVNYVVENGYIETPKVLMQAPFDKPLSFIKLFDTNTQKDIVQRIERIKENAIQVG